MDQLEFQRRMEQDGFCVVPGVLSPERIAQVGDALDRAAEITRLQLGSTHIAALDPNSSNIRVNNLPAADPVFLDLLVQSDALQAVKTLLGEHILVSNFSANIALPGSGSMMLHSDQALAIPSPWHHPWAINVIWTLDDVFERNGATRYLPGSHRFCDADELPPDALDRTVAFEAPAGSFIAMDGRLWHTSGRNTMPDGRRRMMFAYYCTDFIRPQLNWAAALPPQVQDTLDARMRALFALAPAGNTRLGAELTRLPETV